MAPSDPALDAVIRRFLLQKPLPGQVGEIRINFLGGVPRLTDEQQVEEEDDEGGLRLRAMETVTCRDLQGRRN